jgi:hypothetical protein
LPGEPYKTISTYVWYLTQSNTAKAFGFMNLHSYYHNGFFLGVSAGYTFLFSSNVSFVDFYAAIQSVTPRSDHRPTQFVKPSPSSLVASQTQHSLHSQRAATKLLVGHMPRCLKPHPQWFAGTVKYRACGYRCLALTASAPHLLPSCHPALGVSAGWTDKTFGPAKVH